MGLITEAMIIDKSEPLIRFTQITTTDNYYLPSVQQDTSAEEEEEVIKLQKERAEFLRDEDCGIEANEQDDSDEKPTVGEMFFKGKTTSKSSENEKAEGDSAPVRKQVKKDLNALLSRDEQMDVLHRAPWYSLLWCHTIDNKLVRRYAEAESQRSMRPEVEGDSSIVV
ncbi:hypothetical protein Cgig2_006963 [Carnegiea gigantea]|uniref:Uncharacterized protein n=1 Tax=Carnegiea gigantea TaxID=171969 RepID=A0A9Q1QGN7_9CARY|nr:hypothetical protein Cgig2_006963 [Carnegiea gigantea]